MSRGGKRNGAGRPKGTGKFGETTKAVRLPISEIDHVMQILEQKYSERDCEETEKRPTMIDSTLTATERKRFRAVGTLIRQAREQLERAVKEYEKGHDLADVLQYRRIVEIARSEDANDEQRVEKIAEIMRSFNLLCQLDDVRDETQALLEHFATFMESGVFRPSDMPRIRNEFYETLSALMVVDQELE